MDNKFTEKTGQWLNTPKKKATITPALFLLKLSDNQTMYINNICNPEGRLEFIAYPIQKYYNFHEYCRNIEILATDDYSNLREVCIYCVTDWEVFL